MNIDELIVIMRANRGNQRTMDRILITDKIHEIERYSLGTEVDFGDIKDHDLRWGRFEASLVDGRLVLTN